MINKLVYCIKSALQNLRKNLLLNITASTTIAITFIILISALLLVINLSVFKKNWVDQIQVTAYLSNDDDTEAVKAARKYIAAQPEVASLNFVSGDDALNMLRSSLSGQDGILEGLENSPLPGSFEIKLKEQFLTLEGVEGLAGKLRGNSSIEDVEYGQKWLERFLLFFGLLKIGGLIFGGFLFIFSLFIISNTIKLMVYSRRDEIEIMKLVGATNGFIKFPFCIEGVIQGIAGALMALCFIFLLSSIFFVRLTESLHFYLGAGNFVFIDLPLSLCVVMLGAVLGLSGSLLSLNSVDEFKS